MDWPAFKKYNLLIEYKNLAFIGIEGLYVMPELDNLNIWHGTFFIGGQICKFIITIPENYPDGY